MLPALPPLGGQVGFGVPIFPRGPHIHSHTSPLLPIAAEILQANDNLTQVINLYKQLVRGEEVNGDTSASSIPGEKVAGELGRSPPGWKGTESRVVCWAQSW